MLLFFHLLKGKGIGNQSRACVFAMMAGAHSVGVPTKVLPQFTAAAVQAAPVFLDAPATVEKARRLIDEAARSAAARAAGVHVVIGINERAPLGVGALYNSVLVIDDTGRLLGGHRKLVPTWAEKLTWGNVKRASVLVFSPHASTPNGPTFVS